MIEITTAEQARINMKEKKKSSNRWRVVRLGLPIAVAAGSVFLPLQNFGQQLVMLIVLLWIQVCFIFECFN
jgi:hypothetical protein